MSPNITQPAYSASRHCKIWMKVEKQRKIEITPLVHEIHRSLAEGSTVGVFIIWMTEIGIEP